MSDLNKEFKAFINRGNVLALAVAVILGIAFGAVTLSWWARRMSRRERVVFRLGTATLHSFFPESLPLSCCRGDRRGSTRPSPNASAGGRTCAGT